MKLVGRRRLWIAVAASVVVVAILANLGVIVLRPPRWFHAAVSGPLPGVLFRVDTDSMAVALTIDDAPSPEVTPGILAALAKHGARATFFVIGSNAERHPELLDTIRAGGHELGNHLYLDRPSIELESDEFVAMLRKTDALIQPTGPLKWCRPGSGWIDDRMVALLAQEGYRACLVSVYPLDLYAPRDVTEWQFLANVQPGAILVLHDGGPGREQTIGMLEELLPELAARGYRVVTVSELVGMGRGSAVD